MKEYIVPEPKHIALKDVDYKTFFGIPVEELTRCIKCIYYERAFPEIGKGFCRRKHYDYCNSTSDNDYCSKAERVSEAWERVTKGRNDV